MLHFSAYMGGQCVLASDFEGETRLTRYTFKVNVQSRQTESF